MKRKTSLKHSPKVKHLLDENYDFTQQYKKNITTSSRYAAVCNSLPRSERWEILNKYLKRNSLLLKTVQRELYLH